MSTTLRPAVLVLGALLVVGGLWMTLAPRPPSDDDAREAAAPTDRAPVLLHGAAAPVKVHPGPPGPARGSSSSPGSEPPAPGEDEGFEEVLEQDLPDPAQEGPGAVHVTMVDQATQEPVACSVQLWRLNAPANANWGVGDQLQARADVGVEGHRFEKLPVGRYRLHVEGMRKGVEGDPPVFEVGTTIERRAFAFVPPRVRRVRLEVFDEAGRLLVHGRHDGGSQSEDVSNSRPGWRKRRALLKDALIYDESFGWSESIVEQDLRDVEAGPDGFVLAPVTEATRVSRTFVRHGFEFRGRSHVSFKARYEGDFEHVYRAASVSLAPIVEAIRMPDGDRAIDHRAQIMVKCVARRVAPFTIFDPAQHPITVTVIKKGYAAQKFRVIAGQPIARRVLVATE